jgi:hypothetical protein
MATFPIEVSDDEGIVDAVNYLLSGPSGLGQNFQGYSAYLPSYIRPSGRQPWSLPFDTTLDPSVYLSLIITNITIVGGNPSAYLLVTFAASYSDPPFQFGDKLDIAGVIETGSDEPLNNTGFVVFSCTNTTVTVGYNGDFPVKTWNTYVSGGTIDRDFLNYPLFTDCNGRVTVSGATTQVFISAQINLSWEYTCTVPGDYDVVVFIGRLRGFPSATPGSAEYLFADEVLVSEKTFTKTATIGTGTDSLESIFSTVLDGPNLDFGYYWYILQTQFNVLGSYDVTIGKVTTGLRSLTAQVIKQ